MAKKTTTPDIVRPLRDIAREIWHKWDRPYFGAVPYLEAMQRLETVRDPYGADDGRSIVLYFLANANSFRGDDARRIKAELKGHLAGATVHAGIDSITSPMA